MAKYLTIEEYAKLIVVTPKLIYARIRRGVLKSSIIEGELHIKLSDENQIFNAISDVENFERLQLKLEEQCKQIEILEALVESKDRENRTLGAYVGDMKQAFEKQKLLSNVVEIPVGYKLYRIDELVSYFKEDYTLAELKEQIVHWILDGKLDYHQKEIIAPIHLEQLKDQKSEA